VKARHSSDSVEERPKIVLGQTATRIVLLVGAILDLDQDLVVVEWPFRIASGRTAIQTISLAARGGRF